MIFSQGVYLRYSEVICGLSKGRVVVVVLYS